jgi:hypothetical protein
MIWASYKKYAKAIKLHLAFELNRMIPVQFLNTEANASERKVLLNILEAGVTYVAGRAMCALIYFMRFVIKKHTL